MSWLERIFRRRQLRDELADELREHVEEKTEQLMRLENLPRAEARQAALRAFGNLALLEEQSREVWQWPRLESVLTDLKFAFRRLRKSPGFAGTVLLTLAIGIGANTAVFSVVSSVLLKPLPYPDGGQLVSLWLNAPGAAGLANFQKGLPLSASMYFTFSENNRTFQSLGTWLAQKANVTGLARPEEVNIVLVTDGVLETLGVPPLAGRELTAADQIPNGPKNVMLSYGYWQRRFGGDRSVIGRTIVIDSQVRAIVGVMPRGFRVVDHDFDVLVPFAFERDKQPLAGFGLQGIGRLKPGVTISAGERRHRALDPRLDGLILQRPRIRFALVRQMEDHAGFSFPEAGGCGECGQCSLGRDGHDWNRTVDRLRKRSQSAAGSRRGAPG